MEDHRTQALELVRQLSVVDKASLSSGRDVWTTQAIDRLGIPSVTMTDGAHGVRLQAGATDRPGLGVSVPATCFPTASALAATWDPDLLPEGATATGPPGRALVRAVARGQDD